MKVCLQGKSCGMAANGCNCSQICPASSFLGLHPRWSPRALGAERTPPAMLRGRAPPTAPATGAAPALSPPRRVPAPPPPPPRTTRSCCPPLRTHRSKDNSGKGRFLTFTIFFLLEQKTDSTSMFCNLSQNQGIVGSYKRVHSAASVIFHCCKVFPKPPRDIQHIWSCS